MEYTVSQLARLSGVSARTLRYYDAIDLLSPKRVNSSGYRIYGQREVDLLQQILFYRELALSLEEIKQIMSSENFDIESALQSHLEQLTREKERLEGLIQTVKASLNASKGEEKMTDEAKFEAFKQRLIQDNDKQYGEEIRQKYGKDSQAAANAKLLKMSQTQWQDFEALGQELNEKLSLATRQGDPGSDLAQEVCDLHRQWLTQAWPKDHYDAQKHYNISLMYVHDQRFKAYYDAIEEGAAEFLHAALTLYTGLETNDD